MDFWSLRRQTHTHVIGGTRSGKSKFLEWMIREDIIEGRPFAVLDWHGTLYNEVLQFLAYLEPRLRRIILLDPSQPHYVTGFNPFMTEGDDTSALVSRRVQAVVRPWGMSSTDEMPTFERVARMLFTFAVEAKETLPNTSLLLRFPKRELRDYAISLTKNMYVREQWKEVQYIRTLREWREHFLSTDNRLGRFLGSTSVKRFMGQKTGNLDFPQVLKFGRCLIVNLGSSDFLDREAAKVFASLLLNEFFEAAMRRAGTRKLYTIYLDEFQEYITPDLARMLDQVLKGGLHLVMAHQHLGHITDPHLKESIFTNARMRVAFGGVSFDTARELATDMLLPGINERQIKARLYRTIHRYREEPYSTRHHSAGFATGSVHGSSSGHGSDDHESEWATSGSMVSESTSFTESDGVTSGTRFRPIEDQELASESDWTLEEKVSRASQLIMCQPQRHALVKFDRAEAVRFEVPVLDEYGLERKTVLRYKRRLFRKQGAISGAEADRLLAEGEQQFIERARKEETYTSAVRKPTRRK